MPSNPLDLPEVLTVVGSFLPLWDNKYPNTPPSRNAGTKEYAPRTTLFMFRPGALSRCLQVSKLWYMTLLPILCHGYWSSLTWRFPQETIIQHCHLFKVLHLTPFNFYSARTLLEGCTNVVDLDMQIGAISARDGSAGWINGQQAALPGLTEKQLLRANPLIQKLHWSGTEDATLSLDPDDFAGLKTLQDLWLENWTCTEGRLLDVLETVSRTLKRLRLGRIRGIQQENDRNGKDSGSDSTKDIMRLDRLEWLRSHGEKASVAFLAELVKHCPNLRTLELNVKEIWNFDGLASNLRTYCPLLDTLDISSPLRLLSFKTLLRNCSMAGLRTIRVTDSCNEIELVSDILHHASTLEDLQINRSNMRMDGSHFLRPLTECTNLKRFSLNSNFCWFTPDILDTLKQQRWGCRATLQELDLNFEFFGKYYKAMKADIQALEELLLKFGWEKVRRRDREDELAHVAKIQKAFELIQFQELESSLRVLILDDVAFRRS